MKRINVVGTSGSGKSTVSRALAEKLAFPYIELDALFWKENWGESTDEEFFQKIEAALSADNWVLDGNYTRSTPIKWVNVDTVIWVDYSFPRTIFQATKRAFTRSLTNEALWAGNRETFRKSFFSRDSIILWTLKTYKSKRRQYLKTMSEPDYKYINFVHLQSPNEVKRFIEKIPT